MTGMLRPEELTENAVVDPEGKKIGKVGTVYLADDTRQPEWVTVKTGMFGQKESFVPLRGASLDNDGLHVRVSKDKVSDAPRTDAGQHLSEQDSAQLYHYYGMPLPRTSAEDRGRQGTNAPRGRQQGAAGQQQAMRGQQEAMRGNENRDREATGPSRGKENAGESMTRSEEQLRVGTESVESGHVRLRKYTVTEEQQVTVPVTHEEVRLEREPITDAKPGDARIHEEQQDMILHEERPKVEKETVAKERVRLRKDDVTEEQTVSGQVRKEQIEMQDDQHRRGQDRR